MTDIEDLESSSIITTNQEEDPDRLASEESLKKIQDLDPTIRELTEEEKFEIFKKELITKVKIIALDKIGKDPLTNGSNLKKRDKDKVIKHMEDILKLPLDDIDLLFKDICIEKIFDDDKDYTNFPCYSN